jgi:hypothetical protein
MGDRANIVIRGTWPEDRHPKEAVFLYTHWGGEELPEALASGLTIASIADRLQDDHYLSRILFDAMTGRKDEVTGHGISTRLSDNDGYPLLVVDVGANRVVLLPQDEYEHRGFEFLSLHPGVPFVSVLAMQSPTWESLKAAAFVPSTSPV